MMKRPVCQTEITAKSIQKCVSCGWDLANNIPLYDTLSRINDSDIVEYRKKLDEAQKGWGDSQEFIFVEGGEYKFKNILQKIESFFIGKYPVTCNKWIDTMQTSPWMTNSERRHPVSSVSRSDAIKFCHILSVREDRQPFYALYNETEPKNWGQIPLRIHSAHGVSLPFGRHSKYLYNLLSARMQ